MANNNTKTNVSGINKSPKSYDGNEDTPSSQVPTFICSARFKVFNILCGFVKPYFLIHQHLLNYYLNY